MWCRSSPFSHLRGPGGLLGRPSKRGDGRWITRCHQRCYIIHAYELHARLIQSHHRLLNYRAKLRVKVSMRMRRSTMSLEVAVRYEEPRERSTGSWQVKLGVIRVITCPGQRSRLSADPAHKRYRSRMHETPIGYCSRRHRTRANLRPASGPSRQRSV